MDEEILHKFKTAANADALAKSAKPTPIDPNFMKQFDKSDAEDMRGRDIIPLTKEQILDERITEAFPKPKYIKTDKPRVISETVKRFKKWFNI